MDEKDTGERVLTGEGYEAYSHLAREYESGQGVKKEV